MSNLITWARTHAGLASAAAILAVGGVAIGATAASASVPDSAGVIHGCFRPNPSGSISQLGVVDTDLSGGHCASGYTAVSWNQTGPQGATGATGATGPAGADGATGPAGPSTAGPTGLGTTIVTATFTGQATGTVSCPADLPYATGGGFDDSGTDTPAIIDRPTFSAGHSASGWTVEVAGTSSSQFFTVYAICSK